MKPFRTSRRIEFHDTDMAGIVHFANFFRFMESAEVEFLRANGLSVRLPWEGQPIGFPRVSATCDYVSPVRFEDVLDVAVTLDKVGRKSVTYSFDFTCQGRPIAQGHLTAVCCLDRGDGTLESIEIPTSYRQRLMQANEH
jgi:YbgC/YbaW family acyl-CoA thioester hydrolase